MEKLSNELDFGRQIISCNGGKLELQEQNLSDILAYVLNHHPEVENIPVAILAVLGSPKSGKSFMTNLIIHYLADSKRVGWIGALLQSSEFDRGFHFGSVSSAKKYIKNTSKNSGVYLWPNPYIMRKDSGEEVAIYILHYQCAEGAFLKADEDALEMILSSVCSRILEINRNEPEFRVAEIGKTFSSLGHSPKALCKSMVVLLSEHGESGKIYHGQNEISGFLKTSGLNKKQNLLDFVKQISLTCVKHSAPLHAEDGKLNAAVLSKRSPHFKNAVNMLLDDHEVKPKKNKKGNKIAFSDLPAFLAACVQEVNVVCAKLCSLEDKMTPPSQEIGESGGIITFQESVDDKYETNVTQPSDMQQTDQKSIHDHVDETFKASPPGLILTNAKLRVSNNMGEESGEEGTISHASAIPIDDQLEPLNDSNLQMSKSRNETVDDASLTNYENKEDVQEGKKSSYSNTNLDCVKPPESEAEPHSVETNTTAQTNSHTAQRKGKVKSDSMDEKGSSPMRIEDDDHMSATTNAILKSLSEDEVNLVHEAASLIRKTLPSFIIKWIEYGMDLSNLEEFSSLYYSCSCEIFASSYRHAIRPEMWTNFQAEVEKLNIDFVKCLPCIIAPAKQLNSKLKLQTEQYGYLSSKQIKKICLSCVICLKNPTNFDDPKIPNFIQASQNKIHDIHNEMNRIIREKEQPIMKATCEKVRDVYNEKMTHCLNDSGPLSQYYFKVIHFVLLEELINRTRSALSMDGEKVLPKLANKFLNSLKEQLNNDFVMHANLNKANLKKMVLETKNLVSEGFTRYVKNIEEILQKHSNEYDEIRLNMEHQALREEQKRLLAIGIRDRVGANEPIECHCEALMYRIDHYWSAIKQESMANNEKQKTSATAVGPIKHKEQKTDVNTLIIKLSYSYVSIGTKVDAEFKVLKNETGEDKTPIIVGLLQNGDLVYGGDAVKQCYSVQPPLEYWWITDYLGTEHSTSYRKEISIRVGDEKYTYKISVEFLLGFLLRNLKKGAEKVLKTTFNNAIITIPFWTCSSHRIQVKDAAYVAGFTHVRLANEESAAAFGRKVQRHNLVGNMNILVLSESHGIVSAIMYSCSRSKKLTMDAFVVADSLPQFRDLLRSFKKNTASSMSNKSRVDFVNNVCGTLFSRWDGTVYHDVIFLTDSETEDGMHWQIAFQAFLADISQKAKVSDFISMYGLSQISTPSKIGEILLDSVFHDVKASHQGKTPITKTDNIVISNESLTHEKAKPASFRIHLIRNEVTFHQTNVLGKKGTIVGKIDIPCFKNLQNKQIHLVLTVDTDAIVSLTSVHSCSRTEDIEMKEFVWRTANKNSTQINYMKQLVSEMMPAIKTAGGLENDVGESPEVTIEKAKLSKLCNTMERSKLDGAYNFKTKFASELFLKKINIAKEFLSCDTIKKEIMNLEMIHSKYLK